MKKRRKKPLKNQRPKAGKETHHTLVGVVIMPYNNTWADGFKGLPFRVNREEKESWMDFYKRYLAKQATFPPRTWIKFKYTKKVIQHYATKY